MANVIPLTKTQYENKYDWVLAQLKPLFGDSNVSVEVLDGGRECRIHVFNSDGKRTSLVVEHIPKTFLSENSVFEQDQRTFPDNAKNRTFIIDWLREVKKMWRIN